MSGDTLLIHARFTGYSLYARPPLAPSPSTRVTIAQIQEAVVKRFKLHPSVMMSSSRRRESARPRQIGMYLAKHLTPRSLPEIGRRFGGRDHTTVIHAVRQIEKLRGVDAELDLDVRAIAAGLDCADRLPEAVRPGPLPLFEWRAARA